MLELKQIKDLDEYLDQVYEDSQNNQRYQSLISFATGNKFGKTQMRNIETIVYSSNNLSELKNYIKNQVGKDNYKKNWAAKIEIENKEKLFGQILLEEINKVEQEARKKHDLLEFRLKAVRGFIHQFVSDYLFRTEAENNE